MSNYYFALVRKPTKNYELLLDLLETLTEDAFEENDGCIIIRSVDELDDLKIGIVRFSEASHVKCDIIYEKKE
ncbi:50S ribosomal protein L11 methyltransferase, partial [Aliarcobacter butzleri]